MTELHDLSLIERAMRADSQPPQNATPIPAVPQALLEYEECLRALHERVVAAGRVA